jgi:predicted phage-related endonuclease
MGLSRWGSPLSVFVDKLGLGEPRDDPPEFMKWGHILEGPVAKEYAARTERTLFNPGEFTIFSHDQLTFQQVTPDRMILKDPGGRLDVPGSLSIKTGGFFKAKEWDDEPPLEYQVQLQHELHVLGWEWGSFAILIGGQKLIHLDVERDEAFANKMIAAEIEFWDRVLREDPPEADDKESSAKALAALYPQSSGESIALPANPFFDLADDLEVTQATLKLAEARKRGMENRVKRFMGEAEFGILPDGSSFTWKTTERKAYSKKIEASSYRVLRRKKK